MNREERVVKYINSSDDFVVNGKRYCENDFYNDVEDLAKENQELKEKLEEYKRLGFEHLNNKCNKLEKENKILRENAEHNDKVVDKTNWENQKLKNQQKEFIDWLENEKNINPYDISDYTYEDIINTILSKYEEIIDELEKGE